MVAAPGIPPQERKSFHFFLLKHLSVDLNIEREFYTVETRSLFDVFFRGYMAEVEG